MLKLKEYSEGPQELLLRDREGTDEAIIRIHHAEVVTEDSEIAIEHWGPNWVGFCIEKDDAIKLIAELKLLFKIT